MCDDGSEGRDAVGDLMGNKLDRKPLITASVMEVDFGGLTGSQTAKLADAIQKVEASAETKPIRRPFRFSSIAIPYHNGWRWMGCLIVVEKPDQVVSAESASSLGGGIVQFAKQEFPEETFERSDGKLQKPDGIVDNPSPSEGKRDASFEKALGKRSVVCAEGASREEAGRKLLEEQVYESGTKKLKSEVLDFGKLTPLDLNNHPGKASAVLFEHEEILPTARERRELEGPVDFYAPPVALEIKSDHWKVCLVVD